MTDADRWYYRDGDTVRGPVSRADLAGVVAPSTPICRAGSDDWRPAGRTLDESLPVEEDDEGADTEPDDVRPPTLERFRRLCRRAPRETLEREWREHREAYDHRERSILRREHQRRRPGTGWNPMGWLRDLFNFN